MRLPHLILIALCSFVFPDPRAATAADCFGDCDEDGAVQVSDLITMVTVALGERDVLDCKLGDSDGDGLIQVNDLLVAVTAALEGCAEPPFKNSVDHPFDPFLAFSSTEGGPAWVKFTIKVADPTVVYFQDSNQFRFHQDFVTAALPGYIGWTRAEIDAASLRQDNQQLVFGAVLYSPSVPREIAIQLVRQDPYSAEEVITYFDAVRAAVHADPQVPFLYFPTFEQQESAREHRIALEDAGIALGSTARWSKGDECYALGWAYGDLVFVTASEIDAAYADGRLGPDDILLTDGVPAEIPFVAGVLSLVPATPSSHVALLASDWEVPFAFLAQPATIDRVQSLVGRRVVLRAINGGSGLADPSFSRDLSACQVRVVDVTDSLSEDVSAYLRSLKAAPDLEIRPFVAAGSYSATVADATPDDVVTIGGKAANYGFLLRAIPANARPAIAFTFDLWNAYLDQTLEGGMTLRQRIAALLAPFPSYPPSDFGALFAALDEIRDLIDDEANFNQEQQAAIIAALQPFDANQPIRFRSSTNVEDSDVFTGAGLYESESGCLADELDDDTKGPSRCDAARSGERGVFRALRKVYKSFYNDNAFLERLRHHVDESQVGMAVLVNHTFVDASELANGVATLHMNGPSSASATIVSQPGALSVTNPEDAGLPEVVDVYVYSFGNFPNLRQATDRLPLGATVLAMPEEYDQLTTLLLQVALAFGEFHHESQFDIEFEYKKITGEGLELKQVRRLPKPASATPPSPVLINDATEWCTFQGEYADVFANYRLKTRWQPQLVNGLAEGGPIFTSADHAYLIDNRIETLTGAPSTWTDAQHEQLTPQDGALVVRDSWTVGSGSLQLERRMALTTSIPTRLPIVFPDDLGLMLTSVPVTAVPFRDYDGEIRYRSAESVRLVVCGDGVAHPQQRLQSRSTSRPNVAVETGFYWPLEPTGAVAGYTAPLVRWTETSITGIGELPTMLHGFFSQTYRPEHHNFDEAFLFDPHLEADIDPAVVAQWDAAGIRALVLPPGFDNGNGAPLLALTLDGRIVELAP